MVVIAFIATLLRIDAFTNTYSSNLFMRLLYALCVYVVAGFAHYAVMKIPVKFMWIRIDTTMKTHMLLALH